MNVDNSNNFIPSSKGIRNFNLKKELLRYVRNWYFFVFSITLFLALAYVYIRYTVPQYRTSATISISEEDNIGDSALGAFKDLGVLDNSGGEISREIQLIRSKTLIKNVVKKLNLNVQYFRQGKFSETEIYPKSPVEINFLSADSIIENKEDSFDVLIESKTAFSFLDEEGLVESKHSFGKTISTDVGNIILTPSNLYSKTNIGNIIKIKLASVDHVVNLYRSKLVVQETQGGTSVVRISLSDPKVNKAKDIINLLIDEYQKTKISQKQEVSDKTANFINERIKLISSDLNSVDDEAAGYKSKFGLTNDLGAHTQRVAAFDSQSEQEISRFKVKLRLIQSMQNFIQSQEGKNDPIPSNLGFEDLSISNSVNKYNTLVLQRKRLLKTSSLQNPVVINIEVQINSLRQILISDLNSLKNTINIQLSSLETQEKYFSGKLYVAPTREKDLRVIEREQTIKEQLYLYLLQKREEAKITSHITVPNSRIIDRASGSTLVSPNSKPVYLGAFFIGFMIPFLTIYLKGLFDTKINSKEDLEELISIPILGSIPKGKRNKKIIINQKSREPISEAFRILRTNIDFLMAGVNKDKGKVVFVTSSISGEGKTFVSVNLAKTLALYGNKVVIVGADLRYPKIHEFLELPRGLDTKGFSNYIMDSNIQLKDIIYRERGKDSIDIIPSGVTPPNPSGLLIQPKVEEMFSQLENKYDFIVVDTAPCNLVTDTLIIAKYADLSIYLVREGYTDKGLLTISQSYQDEKRLKNMAVLLNDAELGLANNYGY